MKQLPRIPLAWKNLTHNRVRMALFAAGIGFAVVLVFVQLGCQSALLDSSGLMLARLRAELFLVSSQQTTVIIRTPFSRDILARVRGVTGVASAHPLYLEYSLSMLRDTNPEEKNRQPARTIRVIGVDPDAFLLEVPALDPKSDQSRIQQLKLPGKALFDQRSKKGDRPDKWSYSYGPIQEGTETELSGTRIGIVGFFELGSDFGTDGSLVVSEETFRRSLRNSPYSAGLDEIDIGLIRVVPGESIQAVKMRLCKQLAGNNVDVLTREELVARERDFWQKNTPIGTVFGFGVLMGVIVGVVICYQILSGDIRDNLPAYATLRAIGYSNGYLRMVVLEESLLLALLGFIPGWLVSWLIYWQLAVITELPMMMTVGRFVTVLLLTMVMCAGSGLLAVRQAQQADPAEVF